jgi:probable phosphoglycerate mutase
MQPAPHQQVLTRTVATLREVVGRHPDDAVVMVGHDSANRVILLHALRLPLSCYWRLGQRPCAINEMDFLEDSFIVQSMNETCYLKPSV